MWKLMTDNAISQEIPEAAFKEFNEAIERGELSEADKKYAKDKKKTKLYSL